MLKRAIAELLAHALADARAAGAVPDVDPPEATIDVPRDPAHGDYASNLALVLARPARRSPLALAEAIAAHVPPNDLLADVQVAAPGFINVRVAPAWLRANLAALLAAGPRAGYVDVGRGEAVTLVAPGFDDARALSVDAGRRAVVADALAAVLGRAGYQVTRTAADSAEEAVSGASGPVTLLCDGVAIAPDQPEEIFQRVLDEIGTDAARYLLLTRPPDAALALDLGLARRQTADNPAFYVQYTHARIAGILRMAAGEQAALDLASRALGRAPLERLDRPEDLALLHRLAGWPDELAAAARTRDPARLTRYAQTLSSAFHQWYAACRVLTDDPDLTLARIALATGVREVLRALLEDVMGVSAPASVDGAVVA